MSQAITRADGETRNHETSADRTRQLNDITERYFRGEITAEEFVETHRTLGPDCGAAFDHIASRERVVKPTTVGDTAREAHFRLRDILRDWFVTRKGKLSRS